MLIKFNVFLFRKIFFIFCLISCLYEVTKICEIYFSYKTTTSVSYGDFSVISLPAITICFGKMDVLRDHYLDQLNITRNKNNRNVSQIVVYKYCNNHTIEQQFPMFFNYNEIFRECLVLGNRFINKSSIINNWYDKYYDQCENISSIRKSINYYRQVL